MNSQNNKSLSQKLTQWCRTYVAIATLSLISGCASYHSANTLIRTQNPEGADLLQQIHPGNTHAGWLRAKIGQPSSITHNEAGSELWRYDNIQSRTKHFKLIPLLKVTLKSEQAIQYWFEIANDRVIGYWTHIADGSTPAIASVIDTPD
ncbi:MAG: hypothetical protein KUG75_01780 [Pseudomonadales bacterium]|nr:hypothetical protein [Pseudomonadales bacterium]